MKAPDKLYLWETPIVNGGYDPAWHNNSFNDSDVCYIRKDALLERLDKELDRLYELLPDASNENPSQMELRYLGQYMQTEILFDKLNSL